MIYAYRCSCGYAGDVIKPVAEYRNPEFCPKCANEMTKAIAPMRLFISGAKVQNKVFQPALGRAATDSELRAEAKVRGWEEIGNETPSRLEPQLNDYPDFTEEDIKSLTPEKLAEI